VFKLAPPHPEVLHEGAALQLCNGEGAVLLYESDPARRALLLEACDPGTPLDEASTNPRAKILLAAPILRRLWRPVSPGHPFALLGPVAAQMAGEIEQGMQAAPPSWERGLLHLGAGLLRALPREAARAALLHRDYHLSNILAAQREPWLAIDPQPLVGDPAFDAVQLVVEPGALLAEADPLRALQDRLTLVATELELDTARLCAWSVARSVAWAMDSLAVGAPSWGVQSIQMAGLLRRLLG
jgi:streptomycin 6-kinase